MVYNFLPRKELTDYHAAAPPFPRPRPGRRDASKRNVTESLTPLPRISYDENSV
jgi:hypothetical protein